MTVVDFTSNVAPIFKRILYRHTLYAADGTIDRIGVRFATYARVNHCSVTVSISLSNGQIVWSGVLNASELLDNERLWMETGTLCADDHLFIISFHSDNASSSQFVGVCLEKRNQYGLEVLKQGFLGIGRSRDFVFGYGLDIESDDDFKINYFEPKLDFSKSDTQFATSSFLILKDTMMRDHLAANASFSGEILFIDKLPRFDELLENRPQVFLLSDSVEDNEFHELVLNARFFNSILVWVNKPNSQQVTQDFYLKWSNYFAGAIELSVLGDANSAVEVFSEIGRQFERTLCPVVSFILKVSSSSELVVQTVQSIINQRCQGDVEVIVLVSSDQEIQINNALDRITKPTGYSLVVLEQQTLDVVSGLLAATDLARGDLIVFADGHSQFSPDYVQSLADAFYVNDCIAVNGCVFDIQELAHIGVAEQSLLHARYRRAVFRDELNVESFLNCFPGSLAVKKAELPGILDSLKQQFAVEDIDLAIVVIAYHLYLSGHRLKFCPQASIKRDTQKTVSKSELLARLRDYDHAVELLCRRSSKDYAQAAEAIAAAAALHGYGGSTSSKRRIKVLTYRWHVAHQYELYKLPYDFFLVRGIGTPICDQWDLDQRPLPPNVQFIDYPNVVADDYDLAILHFDENVLAYQNTNHYLGPEWGANFKWFVECVNLPKVAICHGTPQFYGQYTPDYSGEDLMQVIESSRQELVDYVKDIEVVCNSYQAQREWMFQHSRVIWHGFDPTEFPPSTYNEGILSPLGASVTSRPHYRGYYLYQQVFDHRFPELFLPQTLNVPKPDISYTGNVYAFAKFRNYVDQIRRFSVYFNPTLRSPMPRARAEPMMCGLVTVNAQNHDVDLFVKNGVNGFYSNDADELRDFLIYLMKDKSECIKIGRAARTTAMDVFNHDRYLSDWKKLIKDTLGYC